MQLPSFYDLSDDEQELMMAVTLGNRGVVVKRLNGLCGVIFVLDQGEAVNPRYVCAKVPRKHETVSVGEMNRRFLCELAIQLHFSHHTFVHWCFDVREVLGVPVALFRYWDGDLCRYMSGRSDIRQLSLIVYCCSGLIHCYDRGLTAHQDLKPANIFVRDFETVITGLPDLDIYQVAMIADFGLANAFMNTPPVFDGSRPYMAPEQWQKSMLSEKTDVFALGVIFHELLTGGFHPAGIRTAEVWPTPLLGQPSKWTRSQSWKTWIARNCPLSAPVEIDMDIKIVIEKMLSIEPSCRPSMLEVRELTLDLIKSRCEKAHDQLNHLIKYFDSNASRGSLEEEWPYLANKWKRLQSRFG